MNSLFYSPLLTVEMAMDDIYIYTHMCKYNMCNGTMYTYIYIYDPQT